MAERTTIGGADALIAGRYRVDKLIGRGSTASVYRARDESLGREVALKIFAPQLDGPGGLARYQAETRLVATFNHPALVTLFDAGTDTRIPQEPRAFLSMEWVSGPDLQAKLRGGALQAGDVACIGAEMASALDYIHGRGVIHRDIKPANILLAETSNGSGFRPKLTDFGIARIIEGTRLTATGTTIGTAAYLSPEQVTGSALGPGSDIYSLGLVLLECLTGTLEFPGSTSESAVARLHRAPRVPDRFGPHWPELLNAMTAMEPSARPTAREIEEALRGADRSGQPAAYPGRKHTVPDVPNRPPRAAGPVWVGDFMPTLAHKDDGHSTTVATVTATKEPRQRRFRWLNLPRLPLWITALVLALLVIAGVTMISTIPPAPLAPEPYPSISGPLGEHIEQLRESITP